MRPTSFGTIGTFGPIADVFISGGSFSSGPISSGSISTAAYPRFTHVLFVSFCFVLRVIVVVVCSIVACCDMVFVLLASVLCNQFWLCQTVLMKLCAGP